MSSPIETPGNSKANAREWILRVRATPKSSRDAIQGMHGSALKVSVQAPPENGKANDALRKLLARKLSLRTSQVELATGQTSRDKRFLISGLSREELESRVTELCEQEDS